MIESSSHTLFKRCICVMQRTPSPVSPENWAVMFPDMDGNVARTALVPDIKAVIALIQQSYTTNPVYRGYLVKVKSFDFEDQLFSIANDHHKVQMLLRYGL